MITEIAAAVAVVAYGAYAGILEFLGDAATKKRCSFADVPPGSEFTFYKNSAKLACIKLSSNNTSLHFENDGNAVIIDEPWKGTLIFIPPATLVEMKNDHA